VSPLVWSFPSIEGPKKELKPVPGKPPNLLNPTSGKIYIRGEDIAGLKAENLKKFRKNIQMIFQDPYESLNSQRQWQIPVNYPCDAGSIPSVKEEALCVSGNIRNFMTMGMPILWPAMEWSSAVSIQETI